MANIKTEAGVVTVRKDRIANWYAWNDLQPPGPSSFHIVGDVQVPNPGVIPLLFELVPQTKPNILLLELILIQQPGLWPQIVVNKQVRFDKANATYQQVIIFSDSSQIAEVPVHDIV